MARKFFYVCAGMLMLALAYHFGATTATAQAPGNSVTAAFGNAGFPGFAFTANGDVYYTANVGSPAPWQHINNIFNGGPTPARQESWGQVKARYAPNRGTAQPGATDR